ncbi:hypothetical protein K432DRAFT_345033 [Lepidopterella palustris CBS 459.81]|uniref:polynucleotide adenylyltransferase n=1 Tax=Lepidopterella palustris CBS 459.81 TaxID=1314670 RepID=A0A8E2EIJ5_9PEZI|nr:hypothetical protein K432DRAFT_345033 [Lepidopterella palustris CBS 459.81]
MEVSTKHSQKNSPRSLAEAMDPMLRSEGSKSNLSRKDRRSLDSRWPSGRSFKMSEELLEYEGQNVLPISNTLVPENSLPWVVKFDTQSMNGIQRLALEISAFHAYMASTPKEKVARKAVIDQLTNLTRETLPDFKLELFGSERTNLSLATSDLDFRLFKPEQGSESLPQKAPRYKERKQWTVQLQKLHADIRRSGPYMLCNFRHARYPLISLQHRDSGIDIQVVLANDTALSREYVKKYLDEYPGLRELFSTIKVMFDVRGLSDVFRGGLGSYSLFMMAVASLKHMPHIQPNDLAQQLLSFLNFWASFDTYQLGISIEPAELFAKSSKTIATKAQKEKLDDTLQGRLKMGQVDIAQPYLLCLQDPAEATNDLGKKGFGIKHIQKTFMTLEKELRKDLQENTRASLLAPLVGSSYVLFKNRRKKMEEYGSSNEGNFN